MQRNIGTHRNSLGRALEGENELITIFQFIYMYIIHLLSMPSIRLRTAYVQCSFHLTAHVLRVDTAVRKYTDNTHYQYTNIHS